MAESGEDFNAEPTFPAETSPKKGKVSRFEQTQQSIDEQTWIGRACTEKLPGGGNFDE